MKFLLEKEEVGEEEEIPVNFRCPILLTLMRDPVITCDGFT
jgi:hypothetical protein